MESQLVNVRASLLFPALAVIACQSLVGFEDQYRLTSDSGSSIGGGGTGADAEVDADGGTAGSDAGSDADAALDFQAACKLFRDALCKSVPSCCQELYGGFQEDVCLAEGDVTCSLMASAWTKKIIDFNPEYIDACLDTLTPNLTTCSLTIELLYDYLDGASPCRRVFAGTRTPGDSCTSSFECADSFEIGAGVICDTNDKCTRYQRIAEGQACTVALYPNLICEDGTYCNKADGTIGQCVPEVPLGQTCSSNQCGIGNRCVASKCEPGLPSGSACADSLECASGLCDANQCIEVPFVQKASCVSP